MAGKKYRQITQKVEHLKRYSLEEAIAMVVDNPAAKFDESVEIAVRLNVDPRQADQNVRGTVVLPHGTGRRARVLVLTKGEKEREAREAGADYVGGEELVARIADESWLDFESVIATPDIMGVVSRVGRILGPRGLMPNPRLGTVTFDVAKAVTEVKAGKVDYRVDKGGVIHAPLGKMSFGADKLIDNARALLAALVRTRPASAKGNYVLGIALSSTMGPGIRVDAGEARMMARAA